jgi:hypothetical protein
VKCRTNSDEFRRHLEEFRPNGRSLEEIQRKFKGNSEEIQRKFRGNLDLLGEI